MSAAIAMFVAVKVAKTNSIYALTGNLNLLKGPGIMLSAFPLLGRALADEMEELGRAPPGYKYACNENSPFRSNLPADVIQYDANCGMDSKRLNRQFHNIRYMINRKTKLIRQICLQADSLR